MSPLNHLTDEELICQIAAGCRGAHDELCNRHQERLLSIAVRYGFLLEDAKDIVQDVFLAVWNGAAKRFKYRAKVETWLYRITLNTCNNFKRKKGFIANLPAEVTERILSRLPPLYRDHSNQLIKKERNKMVREAIEQLPQNQQIVIRLIFHEGLSYQEIADILSISIGTVGSRRNRALANLKRRLEAYFKEV